jgi:hypothetical protein
MNIVDELQKLQALHRSGALTDEEFAAATASVLSGQASPAETGAAGAMQEHLDALKLQNEVARLDREWELERERYLVAGRYGSRYAPSRGLSVFGGVAMIAFGIFWTAMAASTAGGLRGPATVLPWFGVLVIVCGAYMSVYLFNNANQYERAYQNYQRKRARLLGGGSEIGGQE